MQQLIFNFFCINKTLFKNKRSENIFLSLFLLTAYSLTSNFRRFQVKQEPEKDKLNLHLMQCYHTVLSQIVRMNPNFTFLAKT